MAHFFTQLFASLSAYFPWNIYPIKRIRECDDEENNEREVTSQKKQKLNGSKFLPKILRESNSQPLETCVRSANSNMFSDCDVNMSEPNSLKNLSPGSATCYSSARNGDLARPAQDIPALPTRRRSLHINSPSSATEHIAASRITRNSLNGCNQSKPTVFVDLTADSKISPAKTRKRRSLRSQNSSMDLKEYYTYGQVLGSMLAGKVTIPQHITPRSLRGTIDLTTEGSNTKKELSVSPNTRVLPRNKKAEQPLLVEKPLESTSTVSTATQRELKKDIIMVNSFQEKIKDIPCTNEEWVNNIIREYKGTREEFIKTKNTLCNEIKKWSQQNKEQVEAILADKINRHLRITEVFIPEPAELYSPIIQPLPGLTPEMEVKIRSALESSPSNEVLITKFSLTITRKDIQTLNHLNWLNDEVINFYMQLLEERSNRIEKFPKVHTFNTFFYIGLKGRGHEGMKRWTKKVNIFEKDIIIIPIHLTVHWCLAVIDLRKKEINYYDSMGHAEGKCLQHLEKYLKAEHQVKMESELDTTDWKIRSVQDIPQQLNGSDCGVFACTYAEYSSRRAPFTFQQSHMKYFRRKMVYEIITGQLL